MIEIIGKRAQKKYFDAVIRNKSFKHFYILEGEAGVGKKTFADYIAAAIHCERENAPCGACGSCVKHKTGNHPDYIRIENDEPDKTTVTVGTIRKYVQDIYIKPLLADTKIYVLPDFPPIEREGQNAFLKVLEEPPPYALIIFLVNNAGVLLPTVRSRGIICHIDGCTKEETVKFLLKNYLDATGNAELIAALSSGNLGTAASLAEESNFFGQRKEFFDLLSYIALGKRSGFSEVTAYFAKHKKDVQTLLKLLISWLRDVLYIKTARGDKTINKDYIDKLSDFASSVTTEKVMKALETAEDMAAKFSKGNNAEIWAADLMMKLG